MSRIACLVCAAMLAAPGVARADEKKPAAKGGDATEQLLDLLAQEVTLKEGLNLNDIALQELLVDLDRRYNVRFVLADQAFKAERGDTFVIGEHKPRLQSTSLRGLKLSTFLGVVLESVDATYLVRNGALEIVPISHAAKVTKSGVSEDENSRPRLNEPLVSAVVKEKPLNEAVAKIAEMYDLTVVVAPQAGDAKTGFVTARLLNTPADKAIDLLAVQADLRVVRRGTAYLITSRDHANELFGEKLDRERQKVEVEKLREAPAKPPAPPEAPKPEEKKP